MAISKEGVFLHAPATNLRDKVSRRISDGLLGYSQDRTGIIERRPVQHTIVDLLADRLTTSLEVSGKEHLQTIRDLQNNGARIALALNHESHMDAAAVDKSLEYAGFKDLADRLVFIFGIRLERGQFSQLVVRSQNIIRIWPPTETPQTADEKQLKALLDQNAPQDIRHALDNGRIPVIFPQGTRSKEDQIMLPVRSAVAGLLDSVELDYVVPATLNGTQNILPREKKPQRGSYSVAYSEPLDYRALQAKHSDKKHKLYREAMMDEIMIPIARQLPIARRGPYADKV